MLSTSGVRREKLRETEGVMWGTRFVKSYRGDIFRDMSFDEIRFNLAYFGYGILLRETDFLEFDDVCFGVGLESLQVLIFRLLPVVLFIFSECNDSEFAHSVRG